MRRFLLGAVVTSFIVAAGIDGSVAQTADSGTSGLQEIIVTAQKRAENVNTVPIVITVLTNQDLIQAGVDTTQQLEWATPGLVFGNTNGFAQPYIRGIGTDLIGPGTGFAGRILSRWCLPAIGPPVYCNNSAIYRVSKC